jgi:hypothetical protein
MTSHVCFRTRAFEAEPEYRERGFGEDLVRFLLGAMADDGHEPLGHWRRPFHWIGEVHVDGQRWVLEVGLARPDGPEAPAGAPRWYAWMHPVDERSLWQRLLRRPPPDEGPEGRAALVRAMEAIDDLHDVEWVDSEKGRPSLF